MDTNADGALSPAEEKAYLESIVQAADKGLGMTVDGVAVPLIALYDPGLDFLDSRDIARHPHALRLHYFARTPSTLKAGSIIRIADGLWDQKPAMITVEASGADGYRVAVDEMGSALRPSASESGERVIAVRCEAAPKREAPAAGPERRGA
jgi:hypothetical protein